MQLDDPTPLAANGDRCNAGIRVNRGQWGHCGREPEYAGRYTFTYPHRHTELIFLCAAHRDVIPGTHPIRPEERGELESFLKDFGDVFPGVDVFAENLSNVEQARPVLASYPQVSEAMGLAIVSAMLGQSEPQAALDQAASDANDALALDG